jgi:hypothetical protein
MIKILITEMEKFIRWAFICSFYTLGSFTRCVVICSDVIRWEALYVLTLYVQYLYIHMLYVRTLYVA